MAEQPPKPPLTPTFNDKAMTEYLAPFKTTEARKDAIQAKGKAEEIQKLANDYFQGVVRKNRSSPSQDYTRGIDQKEFQKRQNIRKAHNKLVERTGKIDLAFSNRQDQIKQDQALQLVRQQMGGRSLSDEFNRRR